MPWAVSLPHPSGITLAALWASFASLPTTLPIIAINSSIKPMAVVTASIATLNIGPMKIAPNKPSWRTIGGSAAKPSINISRTLIMLLPINATMAITGLNVSNRAPANRMAPLANCISPSPVPLAPSVALANEEIMASLIAAMALIMPLLPRLSLSRSISLSARVNAAAAVLPASSAALPNLPRNTAASLGSMSVAMIFPVSSSLLKSRSDISMACEASKTAPGRRSPNCWRNSSELTLPLDTICSIARSAPSVSWSLRRNADAASATPRNISRCSSRVSELADAAALNFWYAPEVAIKPRLKRLVWRSRNFRSSWAVFALPALAFIAMPRRSIASVASFI